MNNPWYIDFTRAKGEARIYSFYFNFIQWTLKKLQGNPQIYTLL